MNDELSRLVNAAWPYINEYLEPRLQQISGAANSTSSTGSTLLSESDYPEALLRDGSRSLLGNLSVATGKTIDGVDISALGESFTDHLSGDVHTNYAGAEGSTVTRRAYEAGRLNKTVTAGTGLVGGGILTSDITLDIGAGDGLIGNTNDIAVGQGYGILVNANDIELDLDIDAAWTGEHTFGQTIHTQHVIPSLPDTYDIGSASIPFRKGHMSELAATVFAEQEISLVGGWLRLTKDQGTLADTALVADTRVDFGKAMTTGDICEFRGLLTVEYMQVGTLDSGTLYNVTRNLDGSGANQWNAGTPFSVLGTTGNGRIDLDAYNTPRISLFRQGATYNSAVERVRIGDLNGTHGYASETYGAVFGEYASGKGNLTIDDTNGIRLRSYTTDKITLDTSGNATIAGSFTLGASGGIYQGSGTFSSPTTGLKLYNSSGVGVLAGYLSGVEQAKFNTSGEIEAGAGKVKLNARGVEVLAASNAYSNANGMQIVDGSATLIGGVFGWRYLIGASSGHYNQVELNTNPYLDRSKILLQAKSTNPATITLDTTNNSESTIFAAADTVGLGQGAGYVQFSGVTTTNNLKFDTSFRCWFQYDGSAWKQVSVGQFASSFPSSPTDGLRVYRSDRGIEYYYKSSTTQWLSVHEYHAHVSEFVFSVTGTAPMIPVRHSDYAVQPTHIKGSFIVASGHDASNRWTLTFRGYDASRTTATNLVGDQNSWSWNATNATWGSFEFDTSTTAPANRHNLMFGATKVGATVGNMTGSCTFYYRLIG